MVRTLAGKDRSSPVKIIITTFGLHEHFVSYCIRSLNYFWPERPDVIVFSDRGSFSYANKVISPEGKWVPMVLDCLLRALSSGMIHADDSVLLLLEDHIPHASVPDKTIKLLSKQLKQRDNTYLNLAGHGPDQLVAALDSVSLHHMEFDWFSSLHPAIWSVPHLLKTLQFATERQQLSPWQFERIRLAGATHYTTDSSVWPSPFGGFLVDGKVNVQALATMGAGPMRSLRRRLLLRLLREAPGRIRRRARKGFSGLLTGQSTR